MSDEVDHLVDWQLSNTPVDTGWRCPDCDMNWTTQPTICPCRERTDAEMLENAFWEAITRCASPGGPLKLSVCDGSEGAAAGINFGRRIPPELWSHMANSLAEMRRAGVPLDPADLT